MDRFEAARPEANVVYEDLDWDIVRDRIRPNLTDELQKTLDVIGSSILKIQAGKIIDKSGEDLDDETLLNVAADEAGIVYERTYKGYVADTTKALQYIRATNILRNQQVADAGSAEEELVQAFESEHTILGVDNPEELGELENELVDGYDWFAATISADLRNRAEWFNEAIEGIRHLSHEELQVIKDDYLVTGETAYDDLLRQLYERQDRPEQEHGISVRGLLQQVKKAPAKIQGMQNPTQDPSAYDEVTKIYFSSFKLPNPVAMVRNHVRLRFVKAAKEAFGDFGVPLVLNQGVQNDPVDFHDAEQAQKMDVHTAAHRSVSDEPGEVLTRPNWPTEYARELTALQIHNLLYGNSPLSIHFDHIMARTGDERLRQHRKQKKLEDTYMKDTQKGVALPDHATTWSLGWISSKQSGHETMVPVVR
jgi:hypothetical protein